MHKETKFTRRQINWRNSNKKDILRGSRLSQSVRKKEATTTPHHTFDDFGGDGSGGSGSVLEAFSVFWKGKTILHTKRPLFHNYLWWLRRLYNVMMTLTQRERERERFHRCILQYRELRSFT
jgi:hypothetical protein